MTLGVPRTPLFPAHIAWNSHWLLCPRPASHHKVDSWTAMASNGSRATAGPVSIPRTVPTRDAPSLKDDGSANSHSSAGSAASSGVDCTRLIILWSSWDKKQVCKALLCPRHAPTLLGEVSGFRLSYSCTTGTAMSREGTPLFSSLHCRSPEDFRGPRQLRLFCNHCLREGWE